jgi:hypothetical protein
MTGQTTGNTTAFIEAQQYSNFILRNLNDGLLPGGFYRDVSDFGAGDTLNIKSIGSATLQDVTENEDIVYNAIDTGTVTMQITDYVGDAWYITDVLRQDSAQIEALQAARAQEATRAIQEYFETRFLEVANASQTAGATNSINGFAHRIASAETNAVASLDHFRAMKVSFDKGKVPYSGRIAIVDPLVAATLDGLVTQTASVNRMSGMFESILQEGFAQEHEFVMNLFGWNIFTSNRLPQISAETIGSTTVTGGVANVFMSILDDNTKPIMSAWRQMPKTEGERNVKKKRDEFDVTGRFGFGPQRLDTLGILLTSATSY